MSSQQNFQSELKERLARAVRWTRPVVKHKYFWLGVLALVGALAGLYLVMNHVVMPMYTRQGAAVTVPEVRELSYQEASTLLEERDLQPERRDQPFNPSLPRDAVVDQNPQPRAVGKSAKHDVQCVLSHASNIFAKANIVNGARYKSLASNAGQHLHSRGGVM